MSVFAASIPIANLAETNVALEGMGFGPRNFSLPVYSSGAQPTHAAMHLTGNAPPGLNGEDFITEVKALPGVIWNDTEAAPVAKVEAAIAPVSGKWGQSASILTGTVAAGNLYRDADGGLWWVIQSYDTTIWSDPLVIPALIRKARVPGSAGPWVQPLDQFDAYKLVNPFTGEPDRVSYNNKTWFVSRADGAGNNVWAPGVFGWTQE